MIESVVIKNFKSINSLEVSLKNLNLFVGTNSSGKSSIIQALLLLSQNLDAAYGLNGPLVSVGEFREVKNYNIDEQVISIDARTNEEQVNLVISESEVEVTSSAHNKLGSKLAYSSRYLKYLSCDRIGARDVYEKNRTLYGGIGNRGEYAVDYLSEHKDEPLEEDLCMNKENYTLVYQVNYWLQYIVGTQIKTDKILGTDVIKASYYTESNRETRPQNIGAGTSYLISIIIMCLISQKGDLLIIENPEIHLHPSAQSRLCELLYFVSMTGRQIIVETHSDHIFNGIRTGIATKNIGKEDVMIEFVKLGSDNCTRGYEINVGEYGVIENPIADLFDQFEIDINKMIGV